MNMGEVNLNKRVLDRFGGKLNGYGDIGNGV